MTKNKKTGIKAKIFLSLIGISFFTFLLLIAVSIFTVSSRLINEEKKSLIISSSRAERTFYNFLSNMTKTAVIISELKEINENITNPSELSLVLESKEILFPSQNIRILNISGKEISHYINADIECYSQKDFSSHPLLKEKKGGLVRGSGIFPTDKGLCMLSVVPVVDPETLDLKGYIFLEMPILNEFADRLKEKINEEVFIKKGREFIASTYIGKAGNRIFKDIIFEEKVKIEKIEGRRFLFTYFPIKDFNEKTVGTVIIGRDETPLNYTIRLAIFRLIGTSISILIFIVLFAYKAGKSLTEPLDKLSKGANEWSNGNLDHRLNIKTGDELEEVATVLNRMVNSIKKQQRDIEALKTFYESIIESNPIGIIACDETGRIRMSNEAARKILEIENKPTDEEDFFHLYPEFIELKPVFIEIILKQKEYRTQELIVKHGEDKHKRLRILLYPVSSEDEEVVVLQIEDITKRVELEKELLHLRKLATLGADVSRISHEINNILTSLIGHISVLKNSIKSEPLLSKIITIEEIAKRASIIARETLNFSKKEELVEEKVNIKDLLDGIEKMFKRILPENIKLSRIESPSPLFVYGNPGKISLALYNLLINARDAIEAAEREQGNIILEISEEFIPNLRRNFVKISVRDNGIGIPEDLMDKIFTPYFTTKKTGTGLGLSMVKEIVEEMKGMISVESKKGKGSVFHVFIPEYTQEIGSAKLKKHAKAENRKKILIVDDEEDILEFLQELLESKGYTVLTASSGKMAEKIIADETNIIKLAIIDNSLKDASGVEVAKKLKAKNPSVKIIIISGLEGFEMDKDFEFLKKPFFPEEIIEKISQLLKS